MVRNKVPHLSCSMSLSSAALTVSQPLSQTIIHKEHSEGQQREDDVEKNEHVYVEADGSSKVELVAENFVRETRNLLCAHLDLSSVRVKLVLLKVPRRVLNSISILNPVVDVLDAMKERIAGASKLEKASETLTTTESKSL